MNSENTELIRLALRNLIKVQDSLQDDIDMENAGELHGQKISKTTAEDLEAISEVIEKLFEIV